MNFRKPQSPSIFRTLLLAHLSAVLLLGPTSLWANPVGGTVVSGQANINVNGSTLTIDQASALAAINWDGFSIAPGETVNINQLGLDSALLNRVTGADPSHLYGQLSATGRVYVINPNGVLIGPNARIDTQHFIASALDVSDADFLDGGDLMFTGESDAPVVNLGQITAANGDIILVAQVVRNEGNLSAPEGTVALAAGNKILLQPDAGQQVVIETEVSSSLAETGVENTGLIEAAQVELDAAGGNAYELAINQTGVVQATGVERRGGRVLLTSAGGTIRHGGSIAAHDADGSGGEVLIGGDYQGGNEEIANAGLTQVSAGAIIDVSAEADDADAGRAIVWADQQTDFAGRIEGQGGALGGDGAFAEVSGKRILNYSGLADLSAEHGATGTLLLDPAQAIISTAGDDQPNGAFNNGVLAANLDTANVTVDTSSYTSGEIIVNAPVSWTSGHTFTLRANTSIAVNADLAGPGGDIVFLATDGGFGGGTSVDVDAAATIVADRLSFGQNLAASYAGNPPPMNSRALGGIQVDGVLDVGTLDFRLENRGIGGDVSIDHAANKIGTVTTSVTDGELLGELSIVDSDGDLTIDGDLSTTTFNHSATIVTAGDLTLAGGAKISSGNTHGTVVLASTGGSFINHAGASAVTSGSDASSRYLIYSDDPANTTKGGLTGAPVYDQTHAANAPGTITQTGNRFLYSLAPTLTFTAGDLTRSANTANPTLTYAITGLVGGDAQANAVSGAPDLSTTAVLNSSIGDYPISIAQGTVTASDYGYRLAFADGTLTVSASDFLNITADNLNRYYGDANPTFTYTPTGFVNGDTAAILSGFTVNFSTTATANSPAGTYTITPSGAATLDTYGINYQPGTLTVDPRLLTIRADDAAIDYLDAEPTYTATFTGLADFDDASDVPGLHFSTSGVGDAGTYDITPSGAANANYAITFETGTLTVDPRPLTATVRDTTKTFGEANPAFSVSVSGMPFGTSADKTGLTFATSATATSDAGTYAVTASGISNPNYAVTYVPGMLTIGSYALTIAADDFTREYGDANPAFTTTINGLVGGDTIADVITGLTVTTSATPSSNVGNYSLTPTGTTLTSNYAVTFEPGILTVTQAPISLLALGQTHRTYGDANPGSYDLNVVGLKNGDTISGGAIQVFTSTPANPFSGVGTYPVNFDIVSSVNYSIPRSVWVPGTLVVDPRPLTITADSFTREYGEPNPAFTANFDNLASFDTAASAFPHLSIETPATQSANVLDYGINIFGANSANYDVTTVPGTLGVTPATVNFFSADFEVVYGESADMAVLANYSDGLKLTDTISDLRATVDAGGVTDVGTYPVNVTLGNSNYVVGSVGGSVTIGPRPLSLNIINDLTRVYGDDLTGTFQVSNRSIYPIIDPIDEVYRITDPTNIESNVGVYRIGIDLINPNYSLNASNSALLTITPRIIAIKPTNTGLTFGDDFTGVDYLVAGPDGLAPFHTLDDIVADTIYQQYTVGRNFGFTYAYELVDEGAGAQFLGSLIDAVPGFGATIEPGGYQTTAIFQDEAFRNYHIFTVPGALSVAPRPVTLTVENGIGIRNNFTNPFLSTVTNVAAVDAGLSSVSLFPDLSYEINPVGVPERTQQEVLVSDVPLAPAYTDADFFTTFNPSASPPVEDSPGSGGGGVAVDPPPGSLTSIIIPILPDEPPEPETITITAGGTVSVTNTTIVVDENAIRRFEERNNPRRAAVDYRLVDQLFSIRPANFANDRYVVTDVNLGTLTIHPDPVEVRAVEEQTRLNNLRQQFFNPTYVSGNLEYTRSFALGLDEDTLGVALQALEWAMADIYNGAALEDYVRVTGMEMSGWMELSEADQRIVFLSDLHTNPEKQAFMAEILQRYGMSMLKGDIEAKTDAQVAFKAKLDGRVAAVREEFGKRVAQEEQEYYHSITPEGKEEQSRERFLETNHQTQSDVEQDRAVLQSWADDIRAGRAIDGDDAGSGLQEVLNSIGSVSEDVALALIEETIKGRDNQLLLLQKEAADYAHPDAIAARVSGIRGNPNMSMLFGGDVPYADIMTDAMAGVVEDSINMLQRRNDLDNANSLMAGTVAGATGGVGAAAATIGILSKVFIHSTSSIAAYSGAAAGAGAGIGFGIAVGVTRGIQIAKMLDQEAYMNQLKDDPSGVPLSLKPEFDVFGGQTNSVEMQIDTALVNSALLGMFSGFPPSSLSF